VFKDLDERRVEGREFQDGWSCNMKRAWTEMKIARDVQVSGGWW